MANQQKNGQLDRLGRLVLMAAAAKEDEIEAAATSPFALTRVRAAIVEAERRREEPTNWLSLFLVARRAVPVMALVAILAAFLTIWSAQLQTPAGPAQSDDEALFGAPGPGVEQTVLANRNDLSREEVLNIVVDRNYGVGAK